MYSGNDSTSRLLKENGISEKDLRAAIKELRKGSTVHSQDAEATYNALEKYARNLNELARNGRLDPVIGRDDEIRLDPAAVREHRHPQASLEQALVVQEISDAIYKSARTGKPVTLPL